MRGLVLESGRLRLDRARRVPLPKAGEALIRVILAGICATDQAILRGYADFSGILGHEFVGRVVAAPHAPEWLGRRVVGEINLACGVCPACRRQEMAHCRQRAVVGIRKRDGVFADYVVLPVANLHPVPETLADRCAVFVEPLAAALEIPRQTHVTPTDRVVVIGAGKLGLLAAQVLALTGCDLRVIGRHAGSLEILAGLGIPALPETAVMEGLEGLEADLVVECSGHPSGLQLARRLVRPRGRIVLKSAYLTDVSVDLAGLVVDEVTLLGSRCGPFSAALRLLAAGRVRVEPLIEAIFPLEDGIRALTRSGEKGTLKCLIQP
ncbi:MAG: alcohol dehydrogenase catalytic domain-containing protein [Magnetococcales bacterium]|nr:alcohol dehydrogenase catalytic domain-containing protein [Magnetococcales bacterium]